MNPLELIMATKTTTKKTATRTDDAVAATVAQVEKSQTELFSAYGDLTALGQENLRAMVAANQVLAKGAEAISKEMLEIAQSSFEHAALAAQAFFGAKTLQDVIELNNRYAKLSVDSFLANSAKLSDLTVQLATDAAQPLKARVDATVGQLARPFPA
jgi:phasin family protein